MNRLKISLVGFLLLLAITTGFDGYRNISVFAADFDNLRNENGSIDMPVHPLDAMPAILTTPKNIQNAARFNRIDNFCGNPGTASLVQNAVTMNVMKKKLKIDMKDIIDIKLRI
jgi:hypothetical protein